MIIHDVAQGSEEWCALRCGIPTASEFSKVVTSKGEPSKSAETYACTLAAELYAQATMESWEGNEWTDRGKEMESEALSYYALMNAAVTPVGFITDDDGLYGCSPDGLVDDDGMVEVKCLKAENHVKTHLYFEKHGRCPTDYVQQTQGQMMIAGRQWCDLIFYHPVLPELIIRQEPVKEVQDGLATHLAALTKRRDEILLTLRRADSSRREAA